MEWLVWVKAALGWNRCLVVLLWAVGIHGRSYRVRDQRMVGSWECSSSTS